VVQAEPVCGQEEGQEERAFEEEKEAEDEAQHGADEHEEVGNEQGARKLIRGRCNMILLQRRKSSIWIMWMEGLRYRMSRIQRWSL